MYPFLTRYRQNFGKINQEGSVKRCQDKVLRKLMTAAATTRLRLCRKKKNIWSNLERLPFVWKTRKFRGEFKWNGSSRWKFSGKKVMPFEVSPFSRFYWNDRNLLYHLFGLLVPGFMPRESENFAGILSTVQLNPVPVSDGKKNTGIISPKFLTEISVQINGKCSRGGGGGGGAWVNFCWVCATGLSEPLPNYRLFCAQRLTPS